MDTARRVAIVGMGCRYPGANTPTELFENVLAGRQYFRQIPPNRLSIDEYYSADRDHPDSTYCKMVAVLEGFMFNSAEFKILNRTYEVTDIAQWLALQTVRDALDDAGLGTLPRSRTAVILGNSLAGEISRTQLLRFRWPYVKRVFSELLGNLGLPSQLKAIFMNKIESRYKAPFPPVNEDSLAGGLANTIAGRVCNYFDFHGGGYIIDGACSSSLLAISQACTGLCGGDYDLVVSGGVDVSLDPFELVGFAKVGALSNDDIHVYDQRASGFLPGEGCGIVVLKRLDEALADNNRIYAVISGWGSSSDGKGGITAPSINGQALAMERAYCKSGYTIGDVELIEGHGTGTPIGDRTELSAISEVIRRQGVREGHRCGIGSIKSNIGHTKAAAGVAGLIKATLSIHQAIIPPSQGLQLPHELFEQNPSLYPLRKGRKWPSDNPRRRAGISSAGFGGINVHITMESVIDNPYCPQNSEQMLSLLHTRQESEVFFVSAQDNADLYKTLCVLVDAARKISFAELSDLAAYCANHVGSGKIRFAVVAHSPTVLADRLEKIKQYLINNQDQPDLDYCSIKEGIYLKSSFRSFRIVYLFPGQGSQRLNMGSIWRERFPFIKEFWQECDQVLNEYLPAPLTNYIFKNMDLEKERTLKQWQEDLNETSIAQPAIVVASMTSEKILGYFGIQPDIVIGHSMGEYSALWCAGVIDRQTTLQLIAKRGQAMSQPANIAGAMISIEKSPQDVKQLLKDILGYVTISNYNAPHQTVVSGEKEAILELYELCEHQSIRATFLPVSNAFHSRLMTNAYQKMKKYLQEVKFQPLQHLVVSTTTGKFIENHLALPLLLTEQIMEPVRFNDAIHTCLEEGSNLFIEVGPNAILSNLTRSIINSEGNSTDRISVGDSFSVGSISELNQLLGYAFANGLAIKTERVFENRFVRPIHLPYEPRFITSPCESPVEELSLGPEIKQLFQNNSQVDSVSLDQGSAYIQPIFEQPVPSEDKQIATNKTPQNWNEQQIFQVLKDYIVKTFGYPEELIHRNTHILDNLNLDSIKLAELVATAMRKVGIAYDNPSTFAGLSLGELAQKLYQLTLIDHSEKKLEDGLPKWVRNFEVRVEEKTIDNVEYQWPKGPVLIVSNERTPLVEEFLSRLDNEGVSVLLQIGDQQFESDSKPAGCIVIAPHTADCEIYELSIATTENRLFGLSTLLFRATQSFLNSIVGTSRHFFALILQGGGYFSKNGVPVHADYLAGSGFVKSLFLEQEGLETRVIDVNPEMDPTTIVTVVLGELRSGNGHVEAGYPTKEKRQIPIAYPCSSNDMPELPLVLNSEDVILITGGAKGITAKCVLGFAEQFNVKLAIVGSSPCPDVNNSDINENEVGQNLRKFKENNINYRYYQCDVTQHDSVKSLIEQVEKEMGIITGVIHAAGGNTPHLLRNVQAEDFRNVLKPKMLGLTHLLQNLNLDKLKLSVVFSSIIAQTGMHGNSDYAFANEWMNLVLARLKVTHSHIRCFAYNFSVWAEIGMGVRMGSVDALLKMGIHAIPPNEGTSRFVDLLQRKWPTTDLIVTASLGKQLNTLQFSKPQFSNFRFIETILQYQPGVELTSEVFLEPNRDLYLRDHNYEGVLLFPAVIGMEAMSQIAKACVVLPGIQEVGRPTLEKLAFYRPIVISEEGRRIRISALAYEYPGDGSKRVSVAIRSSLTNYKVDHFSCEVLWPATSIELPKVPLNWPEALPIDPKTSLYGSLFFQGPMFQNAVSYHDLTTRHCLVKIKIPSGARCFPCSFNTELLMDSAQVRDAFLHAVQLCVPNYKILPVSIERLVVCGLKGDFVYLSARERMRTDKEFLYDLDIYDDQGECTEQIHGYRCRIVDEYRDKEMLDLFWKVHKVAQSRSD